MNKFQKGGGARDSWKGKSSGGYNKGPSRFGGKSAGGNRFGGGGGGYEREEREMHKATCSDCGNRCEVPFRPNGKRPVLCSNCYTQANANSYGDRGGDRDDRHDRNDREDRGGDRYPTPRAHTSGPSSDALAAQLKEINEKLDVLIEVLTMDEDDLDEMEDADEADLADTEVEDKA